MSPEQAQCLPLDARSDIYSLGATFYAMPAGRPPYADVTPLGIMMMHAREDEAPPPLSQFNPEVTPAVAAIVEKMMAKRPEARYPNMKAVVEAIVAVRSDR